MAVSPLLPRSPSNINANMPAAKARSLTVRNSISATSGKPAQPKQEVDLAEKMNEEIASKYVKGKSLVFLPFCALPSVHLSSTSQPFETSI